MDINSVFPSKYLKAADLKGHEVLVTIDHVKIEDVGDGEKPVLYFQGKERGVVLNKTNAKAIAALFSDETDSWIGMRVIFKPDLDRFQGDLVKCVRVAGSPDAKKKERNEPVFDDLPGSEPEPVQTPAPEQCEREPGSEG